MKSIVQTKNWDECFICHRAPSEVHHIFGGKPNRKFSDQDGLFVHLCGDCHRRVHAGGALMKSLHCLGQEKYEATHTRDEFMQRYGRNYL